MPMMKLRVPTEIYSGESASGPQDLARVMNEAGANEYSIKTILPMYDLGAWVILSHIESRDRNVEVPEGFVPPEEYRVPGVKYPEAPKFEDADLGDIAVHTGLPN